MKDRVKKFYRDHEELVLGVVIGAAAVVIVNHKVRKNIEGYEIERMQRTIYDNGDMDVRAILKNGNITRSFHWTNPER